MPPFSPATAAWLSSAFAAPTAAQTGAWDAIARGEHTLVVAPTGSGKTLAAFLAALDRLATEPRPVDPTRRCRVVYISPLKALAVDVERNLRAPLTGIRQAAVRLGIPEPDVRVAMRSGDTPTDQRRAFTREPPDILITTPESLFLLLTSAAREMLRGVQTVIVDEVHAVCASKRGAHLAVSLERLDALLERPAQRIGLSATVRPVEEVATFLTGGRAVSVVQPPTAKTIEVRVVVPVEDLADLPASADPDDADPKAHHSIWPHVEEKVLDLIESHRSTIVFVNSRKLAERLTTKLNELATERALRADPDADREALLPAQRHNPADVPAQSGSGHPLGEIVVARAHHGSVSREQRREVEEALKTGRLPAVVATSSLELGIDMGAVDLVIQVEAPPSVAAGLQRVGRAGHQVGAVSRGVVFPKYRGDLVECTVVAERMRAGQIESMHYPRNPLDVLAQQVVAMIAMDPMSVGDVEALVRGAAPFAGLPTSALEAVLDMLSGRYPSDEFAELRPRIVWDRVSGELTPRRGAQRLAVTSGGTIPDRGMFGVFLIGAAAPSPSGRGARGGSPGAHGGSGQPGRRVGELDEEMVYESRVGDVFLLGSSSWRIEDITPDRVLVTPAPGQIGRMPFWKGDAPGRPAELGRAHGAFLRELGQADEATARARAAAAGLDDWGVTNLLGYLREQRAAVGHVPDDRTLLVERFRDELGDWRLVVHSPFGAPVNGPWALLIQARIRERHGMDVAVIATDDGIVARLPETDAPPPGADLALFEPDEIEALVTAEVSGSALFASRFRECAARALLLPKRDPGRRTALWQQRLRANQLLQVAGQYGEFPVVLEAMRECLQDVYDVPGLRQLMADVQARRLQVVEVEPTAPSPFARSVLFGFVGMFIYDADAPLAERRMQALSLDSALLAELLGSTELRELLDPEAISQVAAELARRTPERQAAGVDSVHDLLRGLGDLTTAEALERGATAHDLVELESARRAIRVRIAGEERWLAIEDAGRVRDALGTALPVGVPLAFTEPVRDPLGDLVARYARTHGPFTTAEVAQRLGLGSSVARTVLERLAATGRVVLGAFSPHHHPGSRGTTDADAGCRACAAGTEWCDAEVLRRIRRRSLAALRQEIEPVPAQTLGRFLPAWQGVTPPPTASHRALRDAAGRPGSHRSAPHRRPAALARTLEQLAGVPMPASAVESLILPSRISGYSPGDLDALTAAGDLTWAGCGTLSGTDGWIAFAPTDAAELLLPLPAEVTPSDLQQRILDRLGDGQALFLRTIAEPLEQPDAEIGAALWDLVWAGWLTNDTFAPVRALLSSQPRRSNSARAPLRRSRYRAFAAATLPGRAAPTTLPASLGGRWSRRPEPDRDPTRRGYAAAEALLDRHGVLTRGVATAERISGGFAAVYPVLAAAEEAGRARRGYFVDGLGAAQFATAGAVERLRQVAAAGVSAGPDSAAEPTQALVLAATDPANPYGAALGWPAPNGPGGHQPGRKAGALVVLVEGGLALYVERGGRTLLSFLDDPAVLQPAADALALAVREGLLGKLAVERADGAAVVNSPLGHALEAAGFRPTPRGLRLRA